MSARYTHDYGAFDRVVLSASWMVANMRERAERVKDAAEAMAPDAPPIGEGYKYKFEASAGVRTSPTRRAYGRVTNTDEAARFIEFGTSEGMDRLGRHHGATPRHRTLGKALDAAGG